MCVCIFSSEVVGKTIDGVLLSNCGKVKQDKRVEICKGVMIVIDHEFQLAKEGSEKVMKSMDFSY